MLNGADPLLIFHFFTKQQRSLTGEEIDASFLQQVVAEVGIPVPIYLNERLTGIFVENQSRGINVSTTIDGNVEKDPLSEDPLPPIVAQKAIDSTVNVSMLANKDSIMLTAILALMETIVSRLESAEYALTYLNGPIVVFKGLLTSFSTNVTSNDDLIRIDLNISNAKNAPAAAAKAIEPKSFVIPKAVSPVTLGGG